jgi:PleD family two-component response regulator
MNAEPIHNKTSGADADHAVLLLGDDGRMSRLLSRRFAVHPVTAEKNILDGIVQTSRKSYPIILINSECLGEKTAQAVGAIRRVAGGARIVLYGEPFSEIYARAALRAGADDYVIWPVPASELKQQLKLNSRPLEQNKAAVQAAGPGGYQAQLKMYQELAALVPQGIGTIAERAESLLPELFGVKWVKICLPDIFNPPQEMRDPLESARRQKSGDNEQADRVITLSGDFGGNARLVLGPEIQPGSSSATSRINEAASFLATVFELAQRDQCLKRLAIIDELTGAYNRRYLEYFLRQVIEQSRKERTEVTLLLFDIDDFKHYNDTYGHAAGDEILREATRLIKLCCRRHDVVARIGGDEFGVLYWDTGQPRQVYTDSVRHPNGEPPHIPRDVGAPQEGATPRTHQEISIFLSNRFRRIMRTTHFPSLGPEARGMLTISGGLASFPWDGDTVEQLLAKADDALLSAKRSGKNRIYLVGQPQQGTA